MSPQAVFGGMAALFFAWLTFICLRAAVWRNEGAAVIPMLVCLCATAASAFWSYRGTTPEHMAEIEAEEKARRAAEVREQTPHVIREADGCKVYAFKSGDRYHYFTRCPISQTTTESSWETCVTAGKTRTCKTNTESIATQ